MSKTKWRDQFVFLEYQSNFHESLRQIFITEEPFKYFKCYQEIQVKDLIPSYPYNHEYDWYIKELNLIIELHGLQHYKYTNFGSSFEQAKSQWLKGKERDSFKKEAAIDAGYSYIEIPYNAQLSKQYLLKRIVEVQ